MKLNINFLALLFSMAVLITACNNQKKEATLIPKTALSVMHLNLHSMGNKASWQDIKNSPWLQKSTSDTGIPQWLRSLAANPENSGIDFKKGLTFFINGDSTQNTYIALTGTIDNKEKFEKFNAAVQNASALKETDDIKIIEYKNEVAGWHKNQFIYLTTKNVEGLNSQMDTPPSALNLSNECIKLFKTDAKNTLANVESFTSLTGKNGDVQIWINGEEIKKYGPAVNAMSMFKADVFFKDNFSTFNINFEKGEIDIEQKQYGSKEFMNYLKNNIGNSINSDMIERLPAGPVLGVLSLNLKPAAIEELVKLIGADGLVNMFLLQAGFNLQDLTKANNGNFLLALSQKTANITDSNNNYNRANMMLAIGVDDNASAQKIANAARKMIPGGGTGIPEGTGRDINVLNNEQFIVLSNSSAYTNQYLQGDSKQQHPFLSSMKGNAIAGFLDLQNLFTFLDTDTAAWKKEMLNVNRSTWNSVQLKGGKVEKDALNMDIQINFQDKEVNSLLQLNNYINQMNGLQNKRKDAAGGKNLDSLLTPPIFDTVAITGTAK